MKYLRMVKDWLARMLGFAKAVEVLLCPTCGKDVCTCGPLCPKCGKVEGTSLTTNEPCDCPKES